MKFSRFAETIQLKNNNHVVSVTVTLKISDCNGIIYFTDLQLQDGPLGITELRLRCIVYHQLVEVLVQFANTLPPAILYSCARVVIDQAPRYTAEELKHLDVSFCKGFLPFMWEGHDKGHSAEAQAATEC